jgi:hypothetical protein
MLISPLTYDRIGNIGRNLSLAQVAEIARLERDNKAKSWRLTRFED